MKRIEIVRPMVLIKRNGPLFSVSLKRTETDTVYMHHCALLITGHQANLSDLSMVQVNDTHPYEIETPQFVFCIPPYDKGAATWIDGARRIEVVNHTVLCCETDSWKQPVKEVGTIFVCRSTKSDWDLS